MSLLVFHLWGNISVALKAAFFHAAQIAQLPYHRRMMQGAPAVLAPANRRGQPIFCNCQQDPGLQLRRRLHPDVQSVLPVPLQRNMRRLGLLRGRINLPLHFRWVVACELQPPVDDHLRRVWGLKAKCPGIVALTAAELRR